MGLLEEFYAVINTASRNAKFDLPHSSIYYIMSLLNHKFNKHYDFHEVELLLYQEGLAPNKAYGIPLWYRRKYLGELSSPGLRGACVDGSK